MNWGTAILFTVNKDWSCLSDFCYHYVMKIDVTFKAKLEKANTKGGWTYVIWPPSKEYFGTGGFVKVNGRIDGKPFRATFMAMGNGKQMLPVKSETRELIGKDVGDEVEIVLEERIN
jgi:hypothetical protein